MELWPSFAFCFSNTICEKVELSKPRMNFAFFRITCLKVNCQNAPGTRLEVNPVALQGWKCACVGVCVCAGVGAASSCHFGDLKNTKRVFSKRAM